MRQIESDIEERVETGALQINDDWPGLFIRGDDCTALLAILEGAVMEYGPDYYLAEQLYHSVREVLNF